jgi:phospholipid transport system substrate-binding protein
MTKPRGLASGAVLWVAAILGFAIVMTASPPAALAQTADPGQFVQDLGNKAIAQLAGTEIPESEEQSRFRTLLMQYFDLNAIGKFTVGRAYWASATPAQKKEFLQLYATQVTSAYARRFRDYSGEQFTVTGQNREGDSDTLVDSQITRPTGGNPVPVQWRVRAENGSLKIADVVIAGISMAVTDRQQFSAVIERGGGSIQALIEALKNQNLNVAEPPAGTRG